MDCAKASVVKKGKKKQVKDDLDRMKQAEKKKRRLEKALATSAAIRTELEKKKLKKKEQDRLDEESAAIAEAVALQVLLDEDSDDSSQVLLKKHEELTFLNHANNISIFMGERERERHSLVNCHDLLSYSNENDRMWNLEGNSHFLASADDNLGNRFYPQYFGEEVWGPSGFLAAEAVTSLSIADNEEEVDGFVFNRM